MQKTQTEQIDLSKVDRVLERYSYQESWLVMILQDAQEAYNWLPKAVLEHTAKKLKIPLSHVYNVATFYSSFSLKERGRHVIRICDGTACHLRGSSWLYNEIHRRLGIEKGETTEDKLFTLETVACLGACALAPVMTIDSNYYIHMMPENIHNVLDQHRGSASIGNRHPTLKVQEGGT